MFRPAEIDWLLIEDLKTDVSSKPGFRELPLVWFVVGSGYEDEPDGEPSSRRTTPLHHLFKLCWFPNLNQVVRDLFKIYARFDVNYTDDTGLSHFHVACRYGLSDVVEKFLEAGQDPNCLEGRWANSTLHYAVQYGHKRVTESLLRAGVDPNSANVEGSTALHIVCKKGKGADVSAKMLFEISCDDVRVDVRDKRGNAPLHLALIEGNKEVVELLLRNGADPNLADSEGWTPLHVVCKRYVDDKDLAEMFLEICDDIRREVEVNSRDKLGRTPLQLAVANGYKKLTKLLLKRTGVDPNLADSEGTTPLHVISKRSNSDCLMQIFFEVNEEVNRVVQVDVRDDLGRTPLQLAVAGLSLKKVNLILDRGADLSNFVFPAKIHSDEDLEGLEFFKLRLASVALIVVERLEKGGYELNRSDALAVMDFFADQIFDKSVDLEGLHGDGWFVKVAKTKMIKPGLSLYDLIQLRPREAAKLLAYSDYLECAHELWNLPWRRKAACDLRLCEMISRRFFPALGAGSFDGTDELPTTDSLLRDDRREPEERGFVSRLPGRCRPKLA
ncbi:unnamed protein product [Trichogramma brassicae]|uniref:Uncharacterized protein n=1 Tax=Trichogramma brassicae TaxID=86971 RepID=A0A6H5J5R5_9HYME|nr:unnamed protein product [Trichogramma brassicae]